MSRADLFPACASFGPLFIVIGCVLPDTFASGPMAFVGAGATSFALVTLYKMQTESHEKMQTESHEKPDAVITEPTEQS